MAIKYVKTKITYYSGATSYGQISVKSTILVAMSYRLVAKRMPPTLRVQLNNLSLQNRVSYIRFNSYNSNLIQVMRVSVIVSDLFIFENIILSVFNGHFLKKLTHLFTLSFYTDIFNM